MKVCATCGVVCSRKPRSCFTEAVRMLATVLSRMQGHQHKKSPQLRVLRAWDSAFVPSKAGNSRPGKQVDAGVDTA